MRYDFLQKPDFAMVRIAFEQAGEKLLVESSAMVAKDTALQMTTQLQGGILAAAKRKMLGGESLFQNTFTTTQPGQTLYLATGPEGDVDVFHVSSEPLMLASGAFLACAPTVSLDTKWGGARGFFSGAVFRVTPDGTVTTIASGLVDPEGIALDARGVLYIAESGQHRILKLRTP